MKKNYKKAAEMMYEAEINEELNHYKNNEN